MSHLSECSHVQVSRLVVQQDTEGPDFNPAFLRPRESAQHEDLQGGGHLGPLFAHGRAKRVRWHLTAVCFVLLKLLAECHRVHWRGRLTLKDIYVNQVRLCSRWWNAEKGRGQQETIITTCDSQFGESQVERLNPGQILDIAALLYTVRYSSGGVCTSCGRTFLMKICQKREKPTNTLYIKYSLKMVINDRGSSAPH